MKRTMFYALPVITTAALLLPGLLFAQPPQGGQGPRNGPGGGGFQFGGPGGPFGGGGILGTLMRDEVQQELQLVDEQKEKVTAAADEARNQMRDEMRDLFGQMRDMNDDERRARFEEIRSRVDQMNADVEKKLQKVLLPHQYDRLKQIDLQQRIQQRGASALTSGEVADALNLSDEQREKLQQRAEEVQKEMQDKIRQLRVEARTKMLDVLTAEQRAKLESMMGDQFDMPDPGPPNFGGRRGRGSGGPGGPGRGGQNPDGAGRGANQPRSQRPANSI